MTDGREFLPQFKVEYTLQPGKTYIVIVGEYGQATVSCHYGRGEEWCRKVKPGQTLRDALNGIVIDDVWVRRLQNAIDDGRAFVDSV